MGTETLFDEQHSKRQAVIYYYLLYQTSHTGTFYMQAFLQSDYPQLD